MFHFRLAMKTIKLNPNTITNREAELFPFLDHPNIIKYFEHFSSSIHLYLIMEYCQVISYLNKFKINFKLLVLKEW